MTLYFWWCVILLAIFLIGVTKSGFGSGVGLMIVPMTAIALGHLPDHKTEGALGLLLPLLVIGDLIAVCQYRKLFFQNNIAAIMKRILPGTMVGVVLGGLLLWWFHKQTHLVGALMRTEIGLESVGLVGLHWWRQYKGMQEHLISEPTRSRLTGGFAAVSSTLAHAAGPIVAMYLLPLRLERQVYVGTCALYFFTLNTAKLPAYWLSNQFVDAKLSFTILFLPLVFAGAIFGLWLNKRMNDKLFTKLVYTITFMLGWYILYDGTAELIRQCR